MSLLDSLLNEGYRDLREVWIALRADGQLGSGSVDDPFHGGIMEAPPIGVALRLVVGTDPREIVATTASAHGYIEGDIVVLSGALAAGFDGPYQIRVTDLPANQFKCYLDFPTSTSFDGTAVSVKRIFLLDQLFRSLSQLKNLAIHIGPGAFETRGNAGYLNIGNQGWEVREGWKIRGSGIDVTIVKLASARGAPNAQLYLAIGSQTWYMLANYAEASDMTIDCNAQGNRTTSVGAIFLTGSHTRIRRVRAINWGPQGPPESFVINVGGFHPALSEVTDCVVEDCIADQPGLNNTHETTILGITGSPSIAVDGKPGFFRGGTIRRNVVDATYRRNEVPIESITKSGSGPTATANLTTKTPHGRKEGDWVVIAGAFVDGTFNNPYNGSYKIASSPLPTATTFSYALVIGTGQIEPTGPSVGEMFVDRFASHWVTAGNSPPSIVSTADPSHPNQYRLTTQTPHNRIPGNNVRINGVYVVVPFLEYTNAFNASHLVEDVTSPTELLFTVYPTTVDPGTIKWVPNDANDPNYSRVYIGVTFHVGSGGGTCQVVEYNRVMGTAVGVYGDSFSTKSLHVRNNHFSVWSWCFYRNWQNYLSPPGPITNLHGIEGSCLTYSFESGQHVATFTALEPLVGLNVGDPVTIGGASVAYGENNPYSSDFVGDPAHADNWNPDNPYNSNPANPPFTVLALPSPNQFKYVLPRPPGLGNSNKYSNPDLVPSNAGGSPVFSKGTTLNIVTADSLGPVSDGSNTARFISQAAHGFNVGDIVSIFGVKMGTSNGFFNPYNGVFVVTKVVNANEFNYQMRSVPSANALNNPSPMCAKQLGTALTRNGTTARFQTVSPHFLTVGQIVWIDSALVGGDASNPFNGINFAITSVEVTSFTYEMSNAPATHGYGGAGYQGKDTEHLLQFENNVVELLTNAPTLPAYGVVMSAYKDFRPNYIFRQVAIRGNLIRHMDNMADSYSGYSGAISCSNCGALLVDNNVIALDHASPIQFSFSGLANYLNNLTPQGALIKANDQATAQMVDSYFPAAEEAFVLTML